MAKEKKTKKSVGKLEKAAPPAPLAERLCRNDEKCRIPVIPAKAGIQNTLKILDSVSRFACTE